MTNWRPYKMMKLTDFCYQIDSEAPNHFEIFKETGKLPAELEKIEDMTLEQKKFYDNYLASY